MHRKLDLSRQNSICAVLAVGGTKEMAARFVGCTARTIRNTAKDNSDFAERLRQIEISPELVYLKTLNQAARDPKSWRAACWMMEHLYPHRYARKTKSFSQDEVRAMMMQFVQRIQRAFPKGSPERRTIRRRLKNLAKSIVEKRGRRRRKSTSGKPQKQLDVLNADGE